VVWANGEVHTSACVYEPVEGRSRWRPWRPTSQWCPE